MSTTTTDLELRIKAATEGLASVQALADEVDALGGDSKALREEASRLSAELQSLGRQQAVIDNFSAVSARAAAAASELSSLREKAEAASQLQATLAGNAQLSGAALGAQRETVAALATELQRAQQKLRDATAEHEQLARAAQAAGAAQKSLDAELRAARTDLGNAERALASNEAALQRAQSALGVLEQRYGRARDAQRDLTNQVIAAESPTAALIDRHQAATDKVGGLERALVVARDRVAALSAGLDAQRSAVVGAEQGYAAAATAASSAASANGELKDQVAAAKDAVSQAKAGLAERAASLKTAEAAERDLAKAVAADESALTRQAAAVEKLDAEVAAAVAAQRQHADAVTQAGKAADYAGINTADLAAEQQRVTRETALAKSAAAELTRNLQDEKSALAEVKAEAASAATATNKLGNEQAEAAAKAKAFEGNFRTVIGALAGFAGIQLGGQLVKDLVSLADQAKNVSARLQIAAGASELYAQAQEDVLAISLETGTRLESTANLYGRLAQAIKSQGGNAKDAAVATRAITEAFAVSGASAESANAAIVQLAQGLASGTLRGDELNSVLEQAPRLAQAFADSLGITTGQLRQLGEQGALTPQLLLDALKQQAPKIAAEFEQIPVTVGRALANLGTALTVAVGNIDAATGSTTNLGTAINDLANKLIELSGDKGVQATFETMGDVLSSSFDKIAATYYALKTILTSVAVATAEASAAIALGFSKITFGDTSRAFAEAADILQNRAAELRDSVGDSVAKTGERLQAVGQDYADALGHASDAAAGFGTQADKTSAAAGTTGDAVAGMGAKAAGAGAQLAGLSQKASTLADDLSKAAGALNSDIGLLTDGITDQAQKAADALGLLLTRSNLTADGLRLAVAHAIDSAKTGQDLDLIRGAIEKAYAAGKISVDDMRASVDTVTAAQKALADAGGLAQQKIESAAQTLGLNVDAIGNRLSETAKQAVQAFTDIAESGAVPVRRMGEVIDATLTKLSSQKDVQAFEVAVQKAFAAGEISASQYRDTLSRCLQLERELAPAAVNGITVATQGIRALAEAADQRIAKEKETAAAARETADQVKAALDGQQVSLESFRQAIGGAATIGALQELRAALNAAWQDASIGAEHYETLLDQLNSKTAELKEGLQGLDGFAQTIGAWYDSLYADLNQLSAEAAAQFRAMELGQPFAAPLDQVSQLRQQITALSVEIRENQQSMLLWSTGSLSDAMYKTAIHFDQVKMAFAEQELAALQFQQRLGDTSNVTTKLIDDAARAVNSFDLLGEQQLSGLRSAIDSARQKLDSLRESATQTLSSLQEELASAQGDLVTAQRLRNEQRLQELEGQLAQAQALGDKESIRTLQEAIATLREINAINLASAREQQQQAQQTSSTTTQPQTTTTTSEPAKKVTVELVLNGKTVSGDFTESDADALLRMLQQAGLSST